MNTTHEPMRPKPLASYPELDSDVTWNLLKAAQLHAEHPTIENLRDLKAASFAFREAFKIKEESK